MVIKSPKFHFDYEMHPCIYSEATDHVRWWLPLITPGRQAKMHYKAPGTTESNPGLADSRREAANSLAQDLAAQLASGGKRLNEMQERFPLRPAYGQPLQWDGSTKVEGGWHHTEVVETQRPGYPLGLHFDNILNLLLVLVYWLFSPENSLDF